MANNDTRKSRLVRCPNCGEKGHPDIGDNEANVVDFKCGNSNCRVFLYHVPEEVWPA